MVVIAPRVASLEENPTLGINTLVQKMRAEGKKIYNFSVGEPDFPLHPAIREAGIRALHENKAFYTPVRGLPELREAIAQKFVRDNSISCSSADILVTVGAKQGIYLALAALLQPGDEVLIPKPYWLSYLAQTQLLGGKPVIVDTEHFQVKASLLSRAVTGKTKVLILNSPANPTGAVIPKEELLKIVEFARKQNLFIISDEIYEPFVYEGKHCSIASLHPDAQGRTITVNGVSKTYAMTGLRLGYCTGPTTIINTMAVIQNHTVTHTSSISQWMALAALQLPAKEWKQHVEEFRERRDFVVEGLRKMGLFVEKPAGAFYIFLKIPSKNSDSFCQMLLEQFGVATVPGSAFGVEGYLRMSYAAPLDQLKKGLEGLQRMVSSL